MVPGVTSRTARFEAACQPLRIISGRIGDAQNEADQHGQRPEPSADEVDLSSTLRPSELNGGDY